MSNLFKVIALAKCVLTILELNWNQRFWDNKTKLNMCHHMLTSSRQLQNRSFHVVERTRTSSKCQKKKNARAKRAKILFFIVKYANLWGFCCRRRRGCLLGSLSTHVFETRTATGSELFSLLTCFDTTTFTLPRIFSPLEMISTKIWETPLSWHVKCSLPVAVRVSKTRVLKLPIFYAKWTPLTSHFPSAILAPPIKQELLLCFLSPVMVLLESSHLILAFERYLFIRL